MKRTFKRGARAWAAFFKRGKGIKKKRREVILSLFLIEFCQEKTQKSFLNNMRIETIDRLSVWTVQTAQGLCIDFHSSISSALRHFETTSKAFKGATKYDEESLDDGCCCFSEATNHFIGLWLYHCASKVRRKSFSSNKDLLLQNFWILKNG